MDYGRKWKKQLHSSPQKFNGLLRKNWFSPWGCPNGISFTQYSDFDTLRLYIHATRMDLLWIPRRICYVYVGPQSATRRSMAIGSFFLPNVFWKLYSCASAMMMMMAKPYVGEVAEEVVIHWIAFLYFWVPFGIDCFCLFWSWPWNLWFIYFVLDFKMLGIPWFFWNRSDFSISTLPYFNCMDFFE